MAVFDVMGKSFEFIEATDQIALGNGGVAFVVQTTDFVNSEVVTKAHAVIYDRNANGELVRKADVDISTMLPGSTSADTLSIRETLSGQLMIMHDSFLTETATALKGHLLTRKGVGVGDLITLSADELTYEFFEGDYDVDPRNSEQVVVLQRQEQGGDFDFFYDLMLFDDIGAEPKLTRIKTLDGSFFHKFLAFDDGSLYGGTAFDTGFKTELLYASDKGTPNWQLPGSTDGDFAFAMGNRIVTLSVSGPTLGEVGRIDVFERGFGDVPVATANLSHEGEGAITRGGSTFADGVAEIHGTGFAVLHFVETANTKRGYVDIFDLDGDFLKSFQLGGAFATRRIDNTHALATQSDEAIEILVSGVRFGNVGELQSLLATTVKLKTALNLQGTAQSDDIFGLSRNDALKGFEGDDLMRGNAGDDTIDGGEGDDTIEAGDGSDKVLGGKGGDIIFSTGGNDEIFGNDDNDSIDAAGGNVVVRGGNGEDNVLTGAGKDDIKGGADDDNLTGGKGDDKIAGDEGDDIISGGSGNDKIFAGEGNDELRGGNGKDIFIIRKAATDEIVIEDFNHGQDKIDLNGFAGLTSFKKLDIVDLGGSMGVHLGKEGGSPLLELKGLDSLQASDFIF
jgi:Ca2+-binding RTX toxin-like protein